MTKIKGLLIMDVDSTLIQEEGIDLLGELAGSGPEIADITHRAMNGELDFAESLNARVGLLAGLPVSVFDTIRKQIHFTDGARDLVESLHAKGWRVGVVSGGFHETVDGLARELGIDYIRANHLEVIAGKLTGKVTGDIVTKTVKLDSLKKWAQELGLDLVVSQQRLRTDWRPSFFVSHLSCTCSTESQYQTGVKLHGVFPSWRG